MQCKTSKLAISRNLQSFKVVKDFCTFLSLSIDWVMYISIYENYIQIHGNIKILLYAYLNIFVCVYETWYIYFAFLL